MLDSFSQAKVVAFSDACENSEIDLKFFDGKTSSRELNRYDVLDKTLLYSCLVLVKSGVVGIQHVLSDGRRSISVLFLSGEVVDLRHQEIVRNGDFVSLSKSNLDLFCGEDFDAAAEHYPRERRQAEARMQRQLDFLSRHCADLGKKTAAEKFASYVFECCHRQRQGPDANSFCLLLQRIDIADYLGLRQETLSRVIAKLERLALIRTLPKNRLRILDVPILRQIANGAGMTKELAT